MNDDILAKLVLAGIMLHDIPDYGDIFTVKDFILCVNSGELTSDDGSGYYAIEGFESNIEIDIYDMFHGEYDRRFSHVIWYNK